MAVVGTDQEDENKNPQSSSSSNAHAASNAQQGQAYGGAAGGFVGGTGTGSGQGATTSVPTQSQTSQPNQSQNSYANLSQYLQANQGSGATTGQAAENVVQQSADTANQAQNTFNTAANNDIAAATNGVAQNKDTLSGIKSGIANSDQGTLNKITQAGYSYTPDQNVLNNMQGATVDQLNSMVQAGKDATAAQAKGYGGPSDFSNVQYSGPSYDKLAVSYAGPNTTSDFTGQTAQNQSDLLGALDKVQGNVKNAQGGTAGVAALLKNAYQDPNYSQGENSLDAFLAGGTQGGQQALNQAQGVGNAASSGYQNILGALQGKIAAGQQTANNTNAAYKAAIDDATKASNATQSAYGSAVQKTKDTSSAAEKTAEDAAKKAQDELDRRSKIPKNPPPKDDNNDNSFLGKIKETGRKISDETKKVTNPIVSDLKSYPQNAINMLPSIGQDLAGSLIGDQKALNNTATTALTGGLNKLAPSSTKGVTNTASNIAKNPSNAAKQAAQVVAPIPAASSKISNYVKKHNPFAAHGGEVPSYSKIRQMLKRK